MIDASWTINWGNFLMLLSTMAGSRPGKVLQAAASMLLLPRDIHLNIVLPNPAAAEEEGNEDEFFDGLEAPQIAAGLEHDMKMPGAVPPLLLWDCIACSSTIQVDIRSANWRANEDYLGVYVNQLWLTVTCFGRPRTLMIAGLSENTHMSLIKAGMAHPGAPIQFRKAVEAYIKMMDMSNAHGERDLEWKKFTRDEAVREVQGRGYPV